MVRAIAILSGKGGVGKTTLAINLGVALSRYGRHVIVLDANPHGPHIAASLGEHKPERVLDEALSGKRHATEVVHLHPSGLKVVPASPRHDAGVMGLDKLGMVVEELKQRTELVLIDAAPGLEAHARAAMQVADDILLVVTADLLSTADALRTIKMVQDRGKGVYGIVVNRYHGDDADLDVASIQTLTGSQVLVVIPEDAHVRKALRQRQPLLAAYSDSKASKAILRLATLMSGTLPQDPTRAPEGKQEVVGRVFKVFGR